MQSRQNVFHVLLVTLLDEDLISSSFQFFSGDIRDSSITSFDKIMVQGSVGVPCGTDGHLGEVKVVYGVSGDRGGDGMLLPLLVRLSNQDSSPDKPQTNNSNPQNLC